MSFSDKVLGFGAFANRGTPFEINQSLMFNDNDSAYLSRTPSSAGNRKTWTFSAWIKRSNLTSGSTYQQIFGTGNFHTGTSFGGLYIDLNDCLIAFDSPMGLARYSSMRLRDTAAWYHIVFAVDAANTAAHMYVNGVEVTSFSSNTGPNNVDGRVNNTTEHFLGKNDGTDSYFDGYMSEVHFVDGTKLAASDFGETNAITGQWVPKEVEDVTYGTNGFYLKFVDSYPGIVTSASGGDSTATDGDYKVVTFTQDGTFTVNTISGGDAAVDFLVIGGGGGGGHSYGGGGGAGGYRTSFGTSGRSSAAEAPIAVEEQAYTITIGDGGPGTVSSPADPGLADGDPSSIAGAGMTTITSLGGGGGGNSSLSQPAGNGDGQDGGSGGGAGTLDDNAAGYAGDGTAGQGYDGGASSNMDTSGSAGGGGGAGGAGGANTGQPSYVGGAGGVGLASTITGSSVFRAGGGGGGAYSTGGSGGNGGGGYGGSTGAAASGTVNTGGGGGGWRGYGDVGDGGSGVVIIRYKFQ